MLSSPVLPRFCRRASHSEQMADTAGTADYAAVCGEASVLRGFLAGVVLLPQHFTAGTFVAVFVAMMKRPAAVNRPRGARPSCRFDARLFETMGAGPRSSGLKPAPHRSAEFIPLQRAAFRDRKVFRTMEECPRSSGLKPALHPGACRDSFQICERRARTPGH
jgi:hypothetical protein